ncbi:zinc finger MYM-type protein 1-like [Diabrotica undecimpunctata]|uniref:zinc finger MYM-type protein 1-like n=1 Tax=Diabrotica undecimpunctata TaxID=50387 RepID=UPI003B63FCE7
MLVVSYPHLVATVEFLTPLQLEEREEQDEAVSASTNILSQPEVFDVGNLSLLQLSTKVEAAVTKGPQAHPNMFPADSTRRQFPLSLLKFKLPNNEVVPRDWLVWGEVKQALFCFPCRLFCTQTEVVRSKFASVSGYPKEHKWKKLYEKIREHQNSLSHKECYLKWKDLELNLNKGGTIFGSIEKQLQNEITTWKQILHRLLHVTLFLSERGLSFRRETQKVGHPNNGNFLGVLELLGHCDPILSKHLDQVKQSQESNKRMQVDYLSWRTQNEFIASSADYLRKVIVDELKRSKNYSIMVDATPDSSHVEQTSFVFRYIIFKEDVKEYEIHERFLEFSDCNEKTGEDIANLIKEVL